MYNIVSCDAPGIVATMPAMPPLGFRAVSEMVIKKSRFIATVARCDSQAEARALVDDARRSHSDARHHCSAWLIDDDSTTTSHSSDDGEPAGTAGMPMLKVLLSADLVNVAVVVTRYFGGVKLGASGLTRAYSGAVATAIRDMPRVTKQARQLWALDAPHAEAAKATDELIRAGATITNQTHDKNTTSIVFIFDGDPAALVARATQGSSHARLVVTYLFEPLMDDVKPPLESVA